MTANAAAAYTRAKSKSLALAFAISALALAGCETGSGLVGSNTPNPQLVQTAAPAVAVQPVTAPTRLAIAPVIGAPDGVAKQLSAQLVAAIERQKVVVAKSPSERVDFTLRGYVVASKEKTGTKVSYIWDVTDPSGKRVNRITGEEVVAGPAGKDAWASVSPAIVQSVADKTAASFGAWLPTAMPVQTDAGAVASAASAPPAGSAGLVQQASAAGPAGATTLASAGNKRLLIAAPKVTGAPGDGNQALSSAMRRELSAKGVDVNDAAPGTYRVLADVKLSGKADGNQAIAIDWIVNDPQGTRIATVTQNNDIPKGHLDGVWGQNADDAAKGASIQIRQVIADHSAGKPIKSSGSQTAQAQ